MGPPNVSLHLSTPHTLIFFIFVTAISFRGLSLCVALGPLPFRFGVVLSAQTILCLNGCVSNSRRYLTLQKSHMQELTYRPFNDRKRKFVDTELAQDTEGKQMSTQSIYPNLAI